MNKLVPISASVVILGALITPKIVGTQVEAKLNESIAALNAMPGYKVEVIEQDLGWFSSSSKLAFSFDTTMGAAGLAGEVIETKANFDAVYGPVLMGESTSLGLVGWQLSVLADELRETLVWPKDVAFYHVTGTSDFFLNGHYQDAITQFSSPKVSNTQFEFSGYQGVGSYTGELFSYQGSADSFIAENTEGVFKSNNLLLKMDIKGTIEQVFSSGFYDSDSKFSLADISYQSHFTDEVLDIKNTYITASSDIDDESQNIAFDVVYGVDSVSMNEFEGSDFALGIQLNHLSKVFFDQYKALLENSSTFDENASLEDRMASLSEFLLPLVSANPEFNITQLGGTIPEGSFESHLNTSLVGVTSLPQPIDDVAFWLSHLLMDGQIRGDKEVVELAAKMFMVMQLQTNPQTQGMGKAQLEQIAASQVPLLLQTFVQQGLIVGDDTGYQTALSFKDKVFKVNDTQVPLPF